MMFPTIHLGGTDPADLLDDLIQMMNPLRATISVMEQRGPNGRDYPQGPGAIQNAILEHNDRILKLRNVLAELEAIAEHVAPHV